MPLLAPTPTVSPKVLPDPLPRGVSRQQQQREARSGVTGMSYEQGTHHRP